jgi:hypothetical protein
MIRQFLRQSTLVEMMRYGPAGSSLAVPASHAGSRSSRYRGYASRTGKGLALGTTTNIRCHSKNFAAGPQADT